MTTPIGIDLDLVLAQSHKLLATLGYLPSRQYVEQTSGAVNVEATRRFDAAVARAGQKLGAELTMLTSLVEAHADALKAAAGVLAGADADAGTEAGRSTEAVAAVIDRAVDGAHESVTARRDAAAAAARAAVGATDDAADLAAATGSLK